ncbi:MAG: ATP-dependent Clp protease ATP-binding subunit, partial [Elusimicrobia bacterium]|nr:ATP-dependent Clp protease ATP-binding subunit [Elusimicrobiota bacterium]
VKRRPYSVILLDEIEKAHPDVLNILLQVLDDGILTDGRGETVDFKRAIIIMTSNIASREIQEIQSRQGSESEEGEALLKEKVELEIKRSLKPELINRIEDGWIVFKPLKKDQLVDIGKLLIKKELLQPLAGKGHYLASVGLNVIQYIVDNGGYDPRYGARPMRRQIKKQIGDPLSEHLLEQKEESPRKISVQIQTGKIVVASEPMPEQNLQKSPLPQGRLGRWARTILNPQQQKELSPAALKASYDAAMQSLGSSAKTWGIFSVQTPPSEGSLLFELRSDHLDVNKVDAGLILENSPGGGISGWMQKLQEEGFSPEEILPLQAWIAKSIRCGKDCAAAKEASSSLRVRWERSGGTYIFKIIGPALNSEEREEAYDAFEDHFSQKTQSFEDSLREKDRLSGEGKRARALLFELHRQLSGVAGVRFGSFWDQNSSTYWLVLPRAREKKASTEKNASTLGVEIEVLPESSEGSSSDGVEIVKKVLSGHSPKQSGVSQIYLKRNYGALDIIKLRRELKNLAKQKNAEALALILKDLDWDKVKHRLDGVLVNNIVPLIRPLPGKEKTNPLAETIVPALVPWLKGEYVPNNYREGYAQRWLLEDAYVWLSDFEAYRGGFGNPQTLISLVHLWTLPSSDLNLEEAVRRMLNLSFFLADDSWKIAQWTSRIFNNMIGPATKDRIIQTISERLKEMPTSRRLDILVELKDALFSEMKQRILWDVLYPLHPHVDTPEWDRFLELLRRPGLLEGEWAEPVRERVAELLKTAPHTVLQKIEREPSHYAQGLEYVALELGLAPVPAQGRDPSLREALRDILSEINLVHSLNQYSELMKPGRLSSVLSLLTREDIAEIRKALERYPLNNPLKLRGLLIRAQVSPRTLMLLDLYRTFLQSRKDLMGSEDISFLLNEAEGQMGYGDTFRERATRREMHRIFLNMFLDFANRRQDLLSEDMLSRLIRLQHFSSWRNRFPVPWRHEGYRTVGYYDGQMRGWRIFFLLLSCVAGAGGTIDSFMVGSFYWSWWFIPLCLFGWMTAAPFYHLMAGWDAWSNRRKIYRFFKGIDPKWISTGLLSQISSGEIHSRKDQVQVKLKPRPNYRKLLNILQRRISK